MILVWGIGRQLFPDGCWYLTTRGNTFSWDSLCNALGLVTNVAFVPLAVHSTGIFNCYKHPTGLQSMRMIPFVVCFGDEWMQTMLPVGLLSLLLLVVAPFALFCYLVFRATAMPNAVARLPLFNGTFSTRYLLVGPSHTFQKSGSGSCDDCFANKTVCGGFLAHEHHIGLPLC